ncbi:MAG: hypothetical protein AVDCRST_MAG41-4548, partial [uncultured Corynebacteriales bacterium]
APAGRADDPGRRRRRGRPRPGDRDLGVGRPARPARPAPVRRPFLDAAGRAPNADRRATRAGASATRVAGPVRPGPMAVHFRGSEPEVPPGSVDRHATRTCPGTLRAPGASAGSM